ncbi:AMP-binding protein, partial [Cysteiniphilum litorale]|uniref:AMP-binding protein n=1 Tax=Cysteiniphilum litorale TaxID=2056700 RepID=UPI003F880659
MIYTSGTTGKPKGVMVAHKSLANRLVWQKDAYRVDSKSIILQKTPYIFDVSVWELLLPYISGSCLVVAKPNGHKDSEYIYELIQNKNITQCHFVPSMLQSFLMNIKNKNGALQLALKNVVCSGEALSSQVARIFKDIFANIALHNLYGPTEAAIDVSHSFDIDNIETIHIGKPIQNTSLYVLDLNNHPVPIGVVGELHIGGVGLARGYLNRPELTAEKFIPNPFATESDIQKGYTRLYKTGDLVRW